MNSDLEEWNKAAGLWLKEISDQEIPRRILLKAGIEQLIPDVSGKKILDAGSGDGWMCEFLTNKKASVIGVDGSEVFVKEARKNYPGIDFKVSDLLLKLGFPDKTFDIVLGNMLLNSLSDIRVFLSESQRILKDEGVLLISVLHPCLNFPTLSLYKSLADKLFGRNPSGLVKDYFQKTKNRKEDRIGIYLPFYHRTLSDYSSSLNTSGFVIHQIFEPHFLPKEFLSKNNQYEYFNRIARFLFIKAVKI